MSLPNHPPSQRLPLARPSPACCCLFLLLTLLPLCGWSQTATRSPWEMHWDGGAITFNPPEAGRGTNTEFAYAPPIPDVGDPGWFPAPNPNSIGFNTNSAGLQAIGCPGRGMAGDFTYFQTFVFIPPAAVVTNFTISMTNVDDGTRVTIINSTFPVGIVVPGSYVPLFGTGTANLAPYVVIGETNRVVVTLVDDNCNNQRLDAVVVINTGTVIVTNPPSQITFCATIWDKTQSGEFRVNSDAGPYNLTVPTTGMVSNQLDGDGLARYMLPGGINAANGFVTNNASFKRWWQDTGCGQKGQLLTLNETGAGTGIFAYTNTSFFPIDGQLCGNTNDTSCGSTHNWGFTMRLGGTMTFTNAADFLHINGDDDIWVFINGRLVADLGGIHNPLGTNVTGAHLLALGMTANTPYPIDIFFAERKSCSSSLTIATKFKLTTDTTPPSLVCPPTLYVTNRAGVCFQYKTNINFGAYSASDNCTLVSLTNNAPAQMNVGTHLVTWTAMDAVGLTAICTQTVYVVDGQPPSIFCPGDIDLTLSQGSCIPPSIGLGTPLGGDNCNSLYPSTITSNAPPQYIVGTNLVIWTRTDIGGNSVTCTQRVIIRDLEAPSISCPQNVTVFTAPGQCGTNVSYTVDYSDNCANVTLIRTAGLASGAFFPKGTTTNRFVVTDSGGNSNTCSFTVTVLDNVPPAINCPADITVNTAPGQCATNVSFTVTASDICDGARTVTSIPPSGSLFPVGQTIVTNTATDTSGNVAVCTFTVTVQDKQPPTIACPSNMTLIAGPDQCATNVTYSATATDNCGPIASITYSPPSGSTFGVGTTPVTVRATDVHGNTNTCTFSVTVVDAFTPLINCPADLANVPTSPGTNVALNVALGTPSVSENCSVALLTNNAPAAFPLGTTIVTWRVVDTANRTNTCQQSVTIVAPTTLAITCPPTIITNAITNLCYATNVVLGTPTVNNVGCGSVTFSNNAPAQFKFDVGTNTVVWTARDACGNVVSCNQTVIVRDLQKPAITCPANINAVSAPGLCGTNVSFTVLASDNCGLAGSVVSSRPSGSLFPIGTTIVTNVATDIHGNTNVCTFTVTVTDGQNPTISCPSDITVPTTPGTNRAFGVVLGTPATSDSCGISNVVNNAPSSYPLGTNLVTWVVTDVNGRTNSCQQRVIVTSGTPPSISCPATVFVNAITNLCYMTNVVLGTPTINNVGCGSLVLSSNAPAQLPVGTNVVTWTATDACGNSVNCQQLVVVRDIQPPSISCPANVNAVAAPGLCATNVSFTVSATDNCGTVVSLVSIPASGSSFPVGITTVTNRAVDAAGNTNTCTFTVTVTDTQNPTIICPSDVNASTTPGTNRAFGVVLGTPTVNDNCGVFSVTSNAPSSYPLGTNFVTWFVTDINGRTNSCQQRVIVTSGTPPSITCPPTVFVNAITNLCYMTNVVLGTPTINNVGCGSLVLSSNAPAQLPVGTNVVTWTATDSCGNSVNCQQLVVVRDIQPPSISCPANVNTVAAPGQCATNVSFTVSATDNCGTVVSLVSIPASGSSFPVGITTVTNRAVDAAGNTNTCTFTVTVTDTQNPTIICPPDVSVLPDPGTNRASNVNLGTPVVNDNCGISSITSNSPSSFPLGTNFVTWTVVDTASRTNTCQQRVIVGSTQPPTITCPSDIVVNANPGQCFATGVSLGAPVVGSSCGAATVTSNAPAQFPIGTNIVTWTVTDQCGNSSGCQQRVVVRDNQAPAITCPNNIVLAADLNRCSRSNVNYSVNFSDNCSASLIQVAGLPSGSTFPTGVTTNRFVVIDPSGNSNSCAFTVTINDTQPPSITCPPNVIVSANFNACFATGVALGSPAVTDNCAVTGVTSNAPASFPLGTNMVTWTVTDASGNTNACSQLVIVRDLQPPSITCPPDVILTANADCRATNVTLGTPVVSDNCSVTSIVSRLVQPVNLNPVAWWPGENNAVDIVNGNNGVLIGGTSFAPAKVGQGFHFLYDSNYMDVPPSATLDVGAGPGFTLEAWINPVSVAFRQPIFDWMKDGVEHGVHFWVTSASGPGSLYANVIDISNMGHSMSSTSGVVQAGVFQHVAMTYDKPTGVGSFYHNGNLVATANLGTFTPKTTTGLRFGKRFSIFPEEHLVGVLDEPAIYNRALSISEIQAIYNAGVSGKCGTPIPPAVCSPNSFNLGTNIVIWTVTDASGNTNSCTQRVIVLDDQPPTLNCPANINVNAAPGLCGTNVSFNVVSSDQCGTIIESTSIPPSGSYFPVGTTTVTNRAVDAAGNTNTCTFTVTVTDSQNPTIVCPPDVNVATSPGTNRALGIVLAIPAVNDNCGVSAIASNAPSSYPLGTNLVTWVVTDVNGRTNSCQQRVIVSSGTPPVIVCPPTVITNAITNLCYATNVTLGTPTISSVGCGGVTLSNNAPALFPVGTNVVTWTATDSCGNSVNCQQLVVVRDVQPPSISCPANVNTVAAPGQCATNVSFTVSATDNCGTVVSLVSIPASGSSFPVGITTVTNRAVDAAGNTNTCTFTVTVTDTQNPTIICPSDVNVSTTAGTNRAFNVALGQPTIGDNCGVFTVTSNAPSSYPLGTNLVTWFVTDVNGRTNSCQQRVIVSSGAPPVISCPNDITTNALTGLCYATNVALGTPTLISSGCGSVTFSNNAPSQFGIGTNIVTWTARDACGNAVSCQQRVIVRDLEAPTINCPGNMAFTTDAGLCSKGNVTFNVSYNDNCSVASFVQTAGLPSGSAFPRGVTTNRFVVTDAGGNTNTCSFTVTVTDVTPPTIACPTNVIANANTTGGGATNVLIGTPAVSDACGIALITNNAPALYLLGTNVVTWRVVDTSNNTNTCQQLVVVRGAPPTIVCPPDIITNANSSCVASNIVLGTPTISNICAIVSVTNNAPAVFPFGTNVVTWTVRDVCGNSNFCTQRVIVRDTQPPAVLCPPNLVFSTDPGRCSKENVIFSVTNSDNCTIQSVIQLTGFASGTTFPKGVTVNTFRVTDRAGNTNLCSFTVTVNDNEPPGLTCPPDIVIATSPGQPHAPSSGIGVAGATDNCGIATVTNNAPPLLPVGTNIVTWTAVDVSGNQTTCQQKVVVIQTCNGDFGMLPLADQYACPCGVVVFSTVVGALDPVSFQWLFNGQPIPGQTNQSLTIGNLDSTDVGQYTVVASTACKSISSTASLLFLAAPLGNPFSVSNAASISIPAVGNATPYPSVINVQCAPGTLTNLTVTLSGFSHSWPDDVDILLIAPDGRGIKLMSDAGGGGSVNGLTLTFSSSVTNTLPDEDFNGPMVSGTYRPTDFEPNDFVAEATVTNLAQFNGMDPNGEWYLLVRDDTSPDGGFILNGWSLNISWDSSRAQLMNPRRLPDGRFQATLVGQEDVALVVEASTNLTTWLPVSTNVITGGGSTTFTDNQMPPHQRRFYRVVSCQ